MKNTVPPTARYIIFDISTGAWTGTWFDNAKEALAYFNAFELQMKRDGEFMGGVEPPPMKQEEPYSGMADEMANSLASLMGMRVYRMIGPEDEEEWAEHLLHEKIKNPDDDGWEDWEE